MENERLKAGDAVKLNAANPDAAIPDAANPDAADSTTFDLKSKYAEEANKRLHGGGLAQYLDLRHSEVHAALLDDPWIPEGEPINQVVGEGESTKVCILGAGIGGISFAVALIKQGWKAEDLVLVDSAGGFGGTWWWNRYPGLTCDVESYIYMPLLEEMDYMPTRKYASGEEIRLYLETIVDRYSLRPRGLFQSTIKDLRWNGTSNQWDVSLHQKPKGGDVKLLNFCSDFVIVAHGNLNEAKMPKKEGSELYRGDMFHTARWRYDFTGGSPEDPKLERLKGKKVGVIGTGASGVQVVPQVAEWASDLYVFQRTPASVDVRGNYDTDPDTWKTSIATKPGWQFERNLNFVAFLNNNTQKPSPNLVNDSWTRFPSFSSLLGGPDHNVDPATGIADYIAKLYALDRPRSERVRQRVMEEVHDPATARKLQAWYPGWCKRPCFHDEYLPTFNRDNVTLVDTNGQGIERMTDQGIVANGQTYQLDVVIWSTGFLAPASGTQVKAGVQIAGRDGLTLDGNFETEMVTLHGLMTRGFPNLFWSGGRQAGAAANATLLLTQQATHVAHIITEASRKVVSSRPVVEPTEAAGEAWVKKIVSYTHLGAAAADCGPSYLNKEGEINLLPMEEKMKLRRGAAYMKGIAAYVEELRMWRERGVLEGLEVNDGVRK
ncbi:unnamed protein product [Zymoseptoria tritici ST99CH_3D7]|uniref:FAD/NAD(P)-binding domain-containing protein n=1 Tax=Zymoseptoria tritici (strain ST99CH_3D7) TaxID=1276538 RepID=A0A1X7RQ17_ZYMT9|nr:unnamed protein product [Zymoseptoria tritici ST99CH_3D7]